MNDDNGRPKKKHFHVLKILEQYPKLKIVLDPLMMAKSGDVLLTPDAIKIMKEKLFPKKS
jgi:hydroxymethylpyrimidine/phosphomethylpyrimidine kinase